MLSFREQKPNSKPQAEAPWALPFRAIAAIYQLGRLQKLTGRWSILWDKRRSLWIAAEDDPDGIQIEEPDLDVLLSRAEHVNINASRFGG